MDLSSFRQLIEEKSSNMQHNTPAPLALDGGYGWVVVAAAFVAYFIADGWAYSFGIIYPVLIDQFEDSKGKTAIIGALLYGVPLLISPLVCALVAVYGCKIITIIGGLVSSTGVFLCTIPIFCFVSDKKKQV